MSFREGNYENAVMILLDELGYTRLYGPDIERDFHNPLYMDILTERLPHINSNADKQAVDEALYKLTHLPHGSLVQQNKLFIDWLQNGMEVSYQKNGETKHDIIKLIDDYNVNNNLFHAVNQWTVVENETKRPDIVIFVNGLPLVVIELKSCMREDTDFSNGYRQIKNYMHEIPVLFQYNAFCIISDLVDSKVGTITAGFDRFVNWKTVDGNYEETQYARYDVLFQGMLEPKRFLDIIKHFILFSQETPEDKKILAGYHQYFAVRKAVESTCHATQTDGKGGVFWHTQGSGKSLSMVFYAGLLQQELDSPTVVVITDRNDLDDQLYLQFASCKDFLRQTPVQATCRSLSDEYKKALAHGEKTVKKEIGLKDYLEGRQANGIIFTTMQKFEESSEPLSKRRNIIVMADEAHRSQYGLSERVKKDGTVVIGTARIIRDCLPKATFIGFTGTPVSSKERNTREIFGDYIDIYDMTQAVEDGATRPVYYESRVMNLGLKEDVLRQIDTTYELLALHANEQDIERSKKELGNMEAILAAPETIDTLCRDIVTHYEDNRENLLTGKAMIVAYSRPIALDIYRKILELRPDWTEKVKVVMTSGNNDPEEWRAIIGNKSYKKELARKFKDNNDPMQIAIVVDMWLTGFDVPSLATMYVYKPMSGHNLMQAIARVNRVFKDKEGGLVVDFVGIARALKEAMNDYTVRDRKNYGDMDIAKTALPKFEEKLRVCGEFFYGFTYDYFLAEDSNDKIRADLITGGINFILGKNEDAQKLFQKEALLLRQAKTLCQSLLNKQQRMESAYFEAIRVAISKISAPRKLSIKEINEQINEMLKQSIRSEGVINLFSDKHEEFSLFDPAFLEEVGKMREKNLAAELLRKLLSEQISAYQRTNLVQAEKFSERMQRIMNLYRNGQLSNAEVIEELRKMASDIRKAHQEGDDLGLSPEELAFYDAITKPEAIKDFFTHDQLRDMTKELTIALQKSRTIDWQKKDSARAGMRMLVKRLLKKYKYPPEGLEDAIQTVMAQCEMWTDKN
ncbi:Type I site-specific deoxyribonuclease, HsdR family [uncultured Eubacteriales bacterium]|uniref:Type I restriction enzyme endonuclease subunit n=1 Tax=uncultured Eubacteriales bacterium TaxID=172733 RepID=A0A212JBI0_9FIRM|nr:Type I site-specific deoxyribonuclease, HsdR family [uncultured Eubacteriales bacterium]